MILAVLLLLHVLLVPVAAFPRNVRNGALISQSSGVDYEPPPSVPSSQIPHPGPRTCQELLYLFFSPSLDPLPKYLSQLMLKVALENVDCPPEFRNLQQHFLRMRGKNITEMLIQAVQEHSEEGISNPGMMLMDMGDSPGELRRTQRSVSLPEACNSPQGRVLHETTVLIAEYAEKLPSSKLATELKAAALSVSQNCTQESWKQLEEVATQVMKSPEMRNFTMSIDDQKYFIIRMIPIVTHIIGEIVHAVFNYFWTWMD